MQDPRRFTLSALVGAMACILALAGAPPVAAQAGIFFVTGNNVGIGTSTPAYRLEVRGAGSTTRLLVKDTSAAVANRILFKLENNGFPSFALQDTSAGGAQWQMNVVGGGAFTFSKAGSGVQDFRLAGGGHLTIPGNMTANNYITSSSRDLKTDFEAVDARAVLARVAELPISEWRFKDEKARHLGPMAQDFRAAFGLGADSEHIGLMDATAVALAAVQGLNALVEQKDAEIGELRQRLARLEAIVLAAGGTAAPAAVDP